MNSSFDRICQEPEILKRKFLFGNTIHALRNPVDFLGKLTKEYGGQLSLQIFWALDDLSQLIYKTGNT